MVIGYPSQLTKEASRTFSMYRTLWDASGKIQKKKVLEALRHLRLYKEFCADDVISVQSIISIRSLVSSHTVQYNSLQLRNQF
jgi:hypothetical protein